MTVELTMSQNDNILPHEMHSRDPGDSERSNIDQDLGCRPDVVDSRQYESRRTLASVLTGAAVSQLPIWGFAMNYGVFQEYYSSHWTLEGNRDITGIIGTTSNGVMYLSMPFLFALFTRRWARWRTLAALCGAVLACLSFLLSSFSTHVWHLVATQGVTAAFGCALVYSPTTLSLGEWFNTSNRAVAYGIIFSCKNIVGSACPFLFRYLLDEYGFRLTLRIWTGVLAGTAIASVFMIPTHPSSIALSTTRARKIPWSFLKHQTFYVFGIATLFQSSGYGIPQTYLNSYAHDVTGLSETTSTLMLTLFNGPGILSSSFFGWLSDNKYIDLSATTVTSISAISSALSAFLLWGLSYQGSLALLVLFSVTFGFFSSAYSSTWGGVINELEQEAAERNEAIDSGMVLGLLNGARGVGYVSGGLAGVPLLKAGSFSSLSKFGYGTNYGPLIIFTGLSVAIGAFGSVWKWKNLLHKIHKQIVAALSRGAVSSSAIGSSAI